MFDKALVIHWGNNAGAFATQEIALSYWPTTVTQMDSQTLLVAGKGRRGNTVVEEFHLIKPLTVLVLVDGSPKVKLLGAGVSRVTTLYDQISAAQDMIDLIIKDPYSSDSFLARFHSSHDLFRIDHSVVPSALMAFTTVVDTGSVHHEAALDSGFESAWTGLHADLGQIFVFRHALGEGHPVVLFDGNSDGVIDNSLVATPSVWNALDLGDPLKYF